MTPYQAFLAACKKRNLEPKISEAKYLSLREEYPLVWTRSVSRCIEWLDDNEKKMINANRLRNFCTRTKEYEKKEIRKNQERNQDRREKYKHDRVLIEEEKNKQALEAENKKRQKELAETKEISSGFVAEEKLQERIDSWIMANKPRSKEYMIEARAKVFENKFSRSLPENSLRGIIKATARTMIKKNELGE